MYYVNVTNLSDSVILILNFTVQRTIIKGKEIGSLSFIPNYAGLLLANYVIDDIIKVINLKPNHISLYSLILEETLEQITSILEK